jgi:hypothetical protein
VWDSEPAEEKPRVCPGPLRAYLLLTVWQFSSHFIVRSSCLGLSNSNQQQAIEETIMRASHENPLVTSRFEVISAWQPTPLPANVFNNRFSDARLLHGGLNLDLILADTINLPNPVVPVASPQAIHLQLGPNGLLTPPSVAYEWTSSAGSYRERPILGRSLEEILIEKNEALLRVFRDGEERREDERKWLERERKLVQLQEEARRIEKQGMSSNSHTIHTYDHRLTTIQHLQNVITSPSFSATSHPSSHPTASPPRHSSNISVPAFSPTAGPTPGTSNSSTHFSTPLRGETSKMDFGDRG